MAERWLRWYDGTVRDGKFRIVSEMVELPVCTVVGVWASLLEDAATSVPRGISSRSLAHHSMYLGISEHEIESIWNGLERVGTVRNIGNGSGVPVRFEVLNWDKRQFETDAKDPTAKERKTRWKQAHISSGTVRNETERSGTPETETETYKDIRSPKSKDDPLFVEFYSAYPKRQSRKTAAKAYARVRSEGVSHETILAGLTRAKRSDSRFRDSKFTPLPASWLNAGGYADEPANVVTAFPSPAPGIANIR